MFDNRKEDRAASLFHAEVRNSDNDCLVGFLVDISRSGMMLIAEWAQTPGEVLNLHLEVPVGVLNRPVLEFTASIQWCHKDVNPDFHAVGLQFINTGREFQRDVDDIMHCLCFDRVEL